MSDETETYKPKQISNKLLVFKEQELIDRVFACNFILARGNINPTQRHIYSNQKRIFEELLIKGVDFDLINQKYGNSETYLESLKTKQD